MIFCNTTRTFLMSSFPHLCGRAMVMKRYPNGIAGEFFFMKRAPAGKPDWVEVCTIEHRSGNIIDFPIVNDLACLLWIVNLGCIDLNQWYAKCDDVNRPDYLHFDLDPVPGATFDHVLETALKVRDALTELGMRTYPKTTGSKGVHIYVPIVRGPLQKQVWGFAKQFAQCFGEAVSRADYGRVSRSKAPGGPCPGRLQPECLGPNAGVGILGSAETARDRFPPLSPGTRSSRASASRTSVSITFQRACGIRAIFLSRFFNSADDSNLSQSYEPAHTVRLPADGG